MSERGGVRTSERERTTVGDHLCVLGFTFVFGAHSISEEVTGFSRLWFPQGKYLCLLSLVIIVLHFIL